MLNLSDEHAWLLTEVVGCIVRITPSGELYNLLAFPEPRISSRVQSNWCEKSQFLGVDDGWFDLKSAPGDWMTAKFACITNR